MKKTAWKDHSFTFYLNVFFKALKRFFSIILIILLVSLLIVTGIGAGYFVGLVEDTPIPDKQEFASAINNMEEKSTLTFNNGDDIGTLRTDLVRTNIPLSDISPKVVEGLISTEDENFFNHSGVVPAAIMRALISQVIGGNQSSGGSTITQQLVKQRLLTNEVSMERKAKEILLSLRLEHFFSKEQILESYLNVSPYGRNHKGENIAGIEEAAQGVFGVSAKELNLAQAAYLVGMPQNPYSYTPYNQDGALKSDDELDYGLTRSREVLNRMYLEDMISKAEYDEAKDYDLKADFLGQDMSEDDDNNDDTSEDYPFLYQALEKEASEIIYNHLIEADGLSINEVNQDEELVNSYRQEADSMMRNNGLTIQSTVDGDIYDTMNQTINDYYQSFGPVYSGNETDDETGESQDIKEPVQNGSVLIENHTGRVLGFIGGVDFDMSQVDHAFSSRRSPGSSLKPLLTYAPAIEEGIAFPSTPLADTYMRAKQADGSYYEPSNFGVNISHDFITAREALAHSLNNPTLYLYNELLKQGVDVQSYMKKLGLNQAISDDEYENIALSLGGTSTGPTVEELAGAFATFSNDGQYIAPYLIESITDSNGQVIYKHESKPVQVFSPDTAYITSDMLRDVVTDGTWSPYQGQLNDGYDWAVKSGTSEDFRDLWVSGSTTNVTMTSWIGYDNITESRNLYDDASPDTYGQPGARHAKYWIALMNDLSAQYPDMFGANETRRQPESVHEESVVTKTGTKPGAFQGPYGTSYDISSNVEMTTDLFPGDANPPKAQFPFAIGGKVDELIDALEDYRQSGNSDTENTVQQILSDYQKRRQENEEARQALYDANSQTD